MAIYAYLSLHQGNQRAWLGIWSAITGAVMVKGVAGLSVAIAIFLTLLLTNRAIQALKSRFFWLGLGSASLIIVPWHWAMLATHGRAFIDQSLFYHAVYILLQSVLTPAYLSVGNKAAYSTAISNRLTQPAFAVVTASSESQPNDPDKKVIKAFKKELVLFDNKLVVPDVVDYSPKALTSKPSFWKFEQNTVMPTTAYRDHYLNQENENTAQLQLTTASANLRYWQAQVLAPTTVELGITYFNRWQVKSIPAGRVSAKQPSPRGLLSVELAPGNYELVAEYRAGWSNGFILVPFIAMGIVLFLVLFLKELSFV